MGRIHDLHNIGSHDLDCYLCSAGDTSMVKNLISKGRWVILGTILGMVGPWAVTGILTSYQERITFPLLYERLEVTRNAAADMPCSLTSMAYQSVVADVLDWNKFIAYRKEANKHWWSDWFFNDLWSGVELIPLPCTINEHSH